jgi:hypothetical protein
MADVMEKRISRELHHHLINDNIRKAVLPAQMTEGCLKYLSRHIRISSSFVSLTFLMMLMMMVLLQIIVYQSVRIQNGCPFLYLPNLNGLSAFSLVPDVVHGGELMGWSNCVFPNCLLCAAAL